MDIQAFVRFSRSSGHGFPLGLAVCPAIRYLLLSIHPPHPVYLLPYFLPQFLRFHDLHIRAELEDFHFHLAEIGHRERQIQAAIGKRAVRALKELAISKVPK